MDFLDLGSRAQTSSEMHWAFRQASRLGTENNDLYHLSNVENPVDLPLYWLVDRDPYNGLSKFLYNWIV